MLITAISLVLSIGVILTASLLMFSSFTNGILVSRATVGMEVLEDTVSGKISSLEEAYWVLAQDKDVLAALARTDGNAIGAIWERDYGEQEGLFFIVTDAEGRSIYISSNYPFSTYDLSAIAGGTSVNGIVHCDSLLAAMYGQQLESYGRTYGLIVGFDMSNSAWMEKVKSLVDCDVTIFQDNIRLASTITDPKTGKPVVGTAMGEKTRQTVLGDRKPYSGQATIVGRPYYVSYETMYDVNGGVCGAYFAGSDSTEATNEFARVLTVSIVLAVVALAVTLVVFYFFTRRNVVKPIEQVTLLSEEMQRGQLSSTDVDYRFNQDEIGIFARNLTQTKEDISAYIHDISRILSSMGEGDFTQKPSVQYIGDFETIHRSFLEIEVRLAQIVGNMDTSADGVRSGAGQIANGSQLLAEGTTRQATAIEEINTTVTNINAQVSSTAKHADEANALSTACLGKVEEQNAQMTNMLAAMDEIRDKSARISEIIKTIEDITFQTNILALNASVEAARAGEAGKGFAVVADEVRNLAAKSGEAASTTNLLISDTVKAVNEGVALAQRTADIMGEVIEQTQRTNAIIGEINIAAAAQAEAVTQVSQGISDISGVISQNSATAEETAASCQELASQSNLLKSQVDMFKV